MNKRKETAAKILTLLDGLGYNEAIFTLSNVKDEMGSSEQTLVEAVHEAEQKLLDRLSNNPMQSGLSQILFQHLLEQRILSRYREQCLLKLLRQSLNSPPFVEDL